MSETYDINELVITKNTLEKIRRYAALVCKEKNRNVECCGFLLNPKEKNDIVAYNAILACGQAVSSGSTEIGPDASCDSKMEIRNMGYSAVGCWHSHHSMGAWHSSTDDSNLEKLVRTIAGNREIIEGRELPNGEFHTDEKTLLIRENGLEFEIKSAKPITYVSGFGNGDSKFHYSYTKDKKLVVHAGKRIIQLEANEHSVLFREAKKETVMSIGFAYSLVVSGNSCYAEGAVKETCNSCGAVGLKKKPVALKVIEPENDIQFTDGELIEEIKKKVKTNGWFSK